MLRLVLRLVPDFLKRGLLGTLESLSPRRMV